MLRVKIFTPWFERRYKFYVLLNKPKCYLSSLTDPDGRPTVLELLPESLGLLHPVGRLDFNTEGLLLLTNDGDFTNHITAARNRIEKVYEVKVKGVPSESGIARLSRGIKLEDGEITAPAKIRKVEETRTNAWFQVVLHQGRNQQIRRMFDAIGHSVLKLQRVAIGSLSDDKLKPGSCRLLTEGEVRRLLRPHSKPLRSGERRREPSELRAKVAARRSRF